MVLPVTYDLIPIEIKYWKNWVSWRLEERDGKYTKIPYQSNGRRADITNPNTWDNYENIKLTSTRSDGIGFVFSEETGIIGIDWDKVRDPITGEWDKEALNEILSLGSYAELSQSGTGAHVLIKGKIPGDRRKKGNIEMYSKDRFFVVTGCHIDGTPKEITKNQDAINKLYEKRFREIKQEKKKNSVKNESVRSPPMSDREVIQHCRTAANGEKFIKLYDRGDISEYPSHSEADLGLCNIIAFYTQDMDQLYRIFCGGKLYRDDWKRTSQYTIPKALSNLQEVFTGTRDRKESKEKDTGTKDRKKSEEDQEDDSEIKIHFDVIAQRVMSRENLFTMQDTEEFYLYENGVYLNKGSKLKLSKVIRDEYQDYFIQKWNELFPDRELPEHIPAAKAKFVAEVMEYLRVYKNVSRDEIDSEQDRYINFINGLFDIEEWKLKEHTPEIRSIAQVPVILDPNAKCPTYSNIWRNASYRKKVLKF